MVVQAGASDDGRQLAAETAEVVFCAHQTIEAARIVLRRREDPHGGLRARPRSSQDHARTSASFVGRTRQEAQDKFDELQNLIHPEVGVALLSKYIAWDLTGYDVDGPVPVVPQDRGAPTARRCSATPRRRKG